MEYSVDRLYEIIEHMRSEEGYTKERFSEALGKKPDWYEKVLTEKKELGLFEFLNICLELNVPVPAVLDRLLDKHRV